MEIIFGIIGVLIVWIIIIYNTMIGRKNAVKTGFANIDVELKRRFDLIPNLVETAKKYMAHESTTLTAVVAARSNAMGALTALRNNPFEEKALSKMGEAEAKVSQCLSSFNAVAENYPDLKANQTIIQLMTELADTENRISFARQNYNDLVMNYNTSLEVFPNVIFSRIFNFTAGHTWTLDKAEEKENIKIVF